MTPQDWQVNRASKLLTDSYGAIRTADHQRPITVIWHGFLERESDGEVVDYVVENLREDGWVVSAHQSGVVVFIQITEPAGKLLPQKSTKEGGCEDCRTRFENSFRPGAAAWAPCPKHRGV